MFRAKKILHLSRCTRILMKKNYLETKCDRVIFSGIQPTGIPHIGNYLGALKYWIDLQNYPGKIFYSIVDLHSLTFIKDGAKLKENVYNMAACLLAIGINPKRSILFQQSQVMEHTMLAWVLGCNMQFNRLKTIPTWKEKKIAVKDGGNVGLFTYPLLQTADILLYKSTHVPAGGDQTAHIELAYLVASSFNNVYGDYFPKVKLLKNDKLSRIRNLREPSSKMSKSSLLKNNRIVLTDTNDEIMLKFKKALTDDISEVTYDPENRPGVSNLIQIHSGFSGLTTDDICKDYKGITTGEYKLVVAESVIKYLSPIRENYLEIKEDKCYLEEILSDGTEQAREIASKNWKEIKILIGIGL